MNVLNNFALDGQRRIESRDSNLGVDVFTYVSLFFLVGVGFSSLLVDYSFTLANILRICSIGIGIVAVVIRNPKVRNLTFWFLVLGISYYMAQRSGKMTVFFAAVAVVLVNGYPTKKVLGAFLISAFIDFAFLVMASGTGLIDAFSIKDGHIVLSLGLVSANTLGGIAFMFLCLIEYFLGPRRRLFSPLLLVYAFIWFDLTASRTPFVASLILIVLCTIFNDSWGRLKYSKWMCYVPIIMSIVSVGLLVLYARGNPVAQLLDKPLSGRLVLNYMYNYSITGIPILGSAPTNIYSETVDNVYLYMLYRCGLVGLILYNIYYFNLIGRASLETDPFLSILCLLFAVYGLTESTTLLNTCLNPTLLLLFTLPEGGFCSECHSNFEKGF